MKLFIARYIFKGDPLNVVKRMIEIDNNAEIPYLQVRDKAESMKSDNEYFLDLEYIGEIKERLIIKEEGE